MDRRTKYTQKVIKETFINLLEEKEITKITVSEICKIADINRATFYRYYLDVYDLLSNIQKEMEEELKNSYHPETENDNTIANFCKSLLTVLLRNKKLVKVLFDTNDNIYFLNTILEFAYQKCKEKWQHDLPELSDEDIEYASVYIFNGALCVVNFWVKNDFDKYIDEIANIIENISYYGTRRFIYKK